MNARRASADRRTKETSVSVTVNLDGAGETAIATGVGFLDHMLELLGRHSMIDLAVKASGDTSVDFHHTTEDVGIVLGDALKRALGDKSGITRFGSASVPMDGARAEVSLDISGRPFLVMEGEIPREKVGEFDTELVEEFLRALANNLGANLHVAVRPAGNAHHAIEAVFKALARALREAVSPDARGGGIPSTKGVL